MQGSFQVTVWRDSVCAGDDCDAPHEWVLDAPRDLSLRDFIRTCLEHHYLASIIGGKATWILETARPLAVVAQQWVEPRFLVAPESPVCSLIVPVSNPHLRFRYLCQIDPEKVLADLLREKPFSAR